MKHKKQKRQQNHISKNIIIFSKKYFMKYIFFHTRQTQNICEHLAHNLEGLGKIIYERSQKSHTSLIVHKF